MSREAKSRPVKNSASRKSGGSTVLGVFIGLVFGVLIAFGLVWYLNKAPMPFQEKTRPAPEKAATNTNAAAPGNNAGTPSALPGKPGDKPVEKPRFEFYNILPGNEAAPAGKAGDKPADAKPAADKPAEKVASNDQLYLQVGAFQKPADADNLKAKLALMGVEASVQQATTAEKGILHRVRTGPYGSPEEMNKVRNQLAQGGIQATVVKVGNN